MPGASAAIAATAAQREVLLCGYYGVRNLGDELMLACLRQWLAGQGAEAVVAADSPESDSGAGAPVRIPWLRRAWKHCWIDGAGWEFLSEIRRRDALAAGGGDSIRDDRGWAQFLDSIERYYAAFAVGRPVYLWNIGLGKLERPLARRITGDLLRRCRQIIVRDRSSFEFCRMAGAGEQTLYAPDIVLELPHFFPEACAEGVRRAAGQEPYVLVCLRAQANVYGRYPLTPQRLTDLARLLEEFSGRHRLRIAFFGLQSHAAEDDARLHEEIRQRMKHPERTLTIPWSSDPERVAAAFGGASLVVAMRLHAAILARAFQCPVLAMPYDRKVFEFARQQGLNTLLRPETLDDMKSGSEAFEKSFSERPVPVADSDRLSWGQIALR